MYTLQAYVSFFGFCLYYNSYLNRRSDTNVARIAADGDRKIDAELPVDKSFFFPSSFSTTVITSGPVVVSGCVGVRSSVTL